ncbi:MAG: hypothetical protein RJA70_1284 [Pseudomonadota bacterium]|jgi:Cu2+-exporting ATPase
MSLAARAQTSDVALTTLCAHCALPVTDGAIDTQATAPQFCCSGCEAVYMAIHDHGLDAFYQKREPSEKLDPQHRDRLNSPTGYAHFDDPAFTDLHVRCPPDTDGLMQTSFYLQGIHCAACVWLIEKLPRVAPGVISARLSYTDSLLHLSWRSTQVQLSEIAQTLHKLGYVPHPATQAGKAHKERAGERRLLAKIGIAGAAFGNVMLLSLAIYSAESAALGPSFSASLGQELRTSAEVVMGSAYHQFFRWASFVIAVPSVLWTGSEFFRGGWSALKTRTAHMDLPISIGILAALIWGLYGTLQGHAELYFDTVTMLVFLLLLGRWGQLRQSQAARNTSELLFALAPSTTRVVTPDGVRLLPTQSVSKGSIVRVQSGERIGVDGRIRCGESSVDESLLSGESYPRRVTMGDSVLAGTVNLSDQLEIVAESTGHETRLAALVRDVQLAATEKAPIAVFADRVSGVFTVVVLALASVTFIACFPTSPSTAVERAVALLIVTCPCALGLATPLAAGFALHRAAKRGLLVKGMRFLEQLAKPALLVFDKTGTLTQGVLKVVDYEGGTQVSSLVRSAEQRSAHPIAEALRRGLPPAPLLPVLEFESFSGLGVRALLQREGTPQDEASAPLEIFIGSARFVAERAQVATNLPRASVLIGRGLSPVFVASEGQVIAVLGVGDPERPEAAECLQKLKAYGHQFAILSGDRSELVAQVAGHMGVDWVDLLGEQTPEQKLEYIKHKQATLPVVMIGDGVNDAAALSAASVGIAMHGGAEASLAAADAFATRAGLTPLVELVELSRATMRVIHRNLGFSLFYNSLAAGLAMLGYVTPLVAAILMPISSVTVVISSLLQRQPSENGQDK